MSGEDNVLGAPYGLKDTLTVGHISGRRTWDKRMGSMRALEFLQTDAAINSGNSGGPMFNLAGELYSGAFYGQLFRVLDRRGRVFHYIGNPDSPSGSRVTRGVVRRLHDAGFTQVRHRPEAFGVVAQK